MVEHFTTCPIAQGTGTDCRCQCVPDAHQGYATAAPLPAGRELDALVAERVMGWEWTAFGDGVRVLRNLRTLMHGVTEIDGRVSHNPALPCYSTDIAAAWSVVNAMVMHGHFFHVARYTAASPTATEQELREAWRASFDSKGGKDAWAETAPLAICRAALEIR